MCRCLTSTEFIQCIDQQYISWASRWNNPDKDADNTLNNLFGNKLNMLNLNLLPPSEKKELRLGRISRLVIYYQGMAFLFLGIFLVLLLGLRIIISSEIENVNTAIRIEKAILEAQQIRKLEEGIEELNEKMSSLAAIEKEAVLFSAVLEELADNIPGGARMNLFEADSESRRASFSGLATSRKDVSFLEQALEDSEVFQDIDSPLSNYIRKEDIDFWFGFTVK